ncbi:MAG TPA: AAA family ATPase [Syntrophomonadaceae bacterium]|nr:AAA family ATPase [Syntrophomonadaceae bacterium]
MAGKSPGKKVIVVTGDVTIDWNIARLKREKDTGKAWNDSDMVQIGFKPGGAAMLGCVIQNLVNKMDTITGGSYAVKQVSLAGDEINAADCRFTRSHTMWKPFPKSTGSKEQVWRVEEFLGLDTAAPSEQTVKDLMPDDPRKADIMILDDAGLGFRDNRQFWPQTMLKPEGCDWIIIKMASPVADGPLWEHLVSFRPDRTIALMTVNDLRRTEAHISRGLSWEKTGQDLYWELVYNPVLKAVSACAHVIVSLGTSGALLLSKPEKNMHKWECTLFFDPQFSEGNWEHDYPGGMIGYTTCLTAAIARQLMVDPQQPRLDLAIQTGIHAMRCLHIQGFGGQKPNEALMPPIFPINQVIDAICSDKQPLYTAKVKDPVGFIPDSLKPEFWTILDDISSVPTDNRQSLSERAKRIVEYGNDIGLQGLPLGKFGNLTTADRHEIEGFSSIQTLIMEYCRRSKDKPLNLAVFGPPGSGKSFGVKQVAKSIPDVEIKDCTFNLSQFTSARDLNDAFHQVRDISLSGKMPLVFWDEFDTRFEGQNNGWLRYFLAPMQDGEFQDGQITHHIGRAIFVFAGGTCATFKKFDRHYDQEDLLALEESKRDEARQISDKFKEVKGPDFVSRLQGFVNIMGPNRLQGVLPVEDKHFLIRRAIVLRSLLENNAPCLFAEPKGKGRLYIDAGVLRAFLQVSRYKHGVRSMEAIINMSSLAGRSSFERSCLPPREQLNMHVNGLECLSLVQQPDFNDPDLLDKLARANHEVYTVSLKDKKDAPREALLTFDELSPDLQLQNIESVRDIPNKLSVIGHIIIAARSGAPAFIFPGSYLEMLSEMEHERYLEAKAAAGWKYGPKKDPGKKENPSLRPWRKLTEQQLAELPPAVAAAIQNEELPENEKDKDREIVKGMPELLRKVGFTIVDMNKS